ncbi:DUF2157 domain-containing protein [Rubrivivax gelatinosus]|nr:DUF2157 domain-containing protein [Rubrivivax gelatinosus]
MRITRAELDDAAGSGLISLQQANELWQFLAARQRETPGFKPAHILYYLGGLIAIGAMSLFITLGWQRLGGGGLLAIALGYGAVAVGLTEYLLRRRRLAIPAGISAALAIALVPLAVYGLQHLLGYWSDTDPAQTYRAFHQRIDWRWVLMEAATLAAGAVALWRWRLPFIVMPVAVTLWYLCMDVVPLLLGGSAHGFFTDEGKRVSLALGAVMLLIAFWVDLRSRATRDFAFWLYIFGTLSFWGGLTAMDSGSELGRFLYACINLLLIAVGAALSRRVFAVFGGLGLALYLGHLAATVFKDSLLFPVALTAIGFAVVVAGVLWQRHEATIGLRLRALLPAAIRELVERRATT